MFARNLTRKGFVMAVVVVLSNDALGEAALERAIAEAQLRRLPLVLAAGAGAPLSEPQARAYETRREVVKSALEAKVAELNDRGVPTSGFFPSAPSDSSSAALDAARQYNAELIVVGLRRRSPVGKLILGSMTQEILLGADCAVIGVKLAREDEDRL